MLSLQGFNPGSWQGQGVVLALVWGCSLSLPQIWGIWDFGGPSVFPPKFFLEKGKSLSVVMQSQIGKEVQFTSDVLGSLPVFFHSLLTRIGSG